MAEFTLPANSIVKKTGNVFAAPADAVNVRTFKIYRYDPDGGAFSRWRLDRAGGPWSSLSGSR